MVGFDQSTFDIKHILLVGVDNRKFYATKRDPKAEEEIAKTNDEGDFSRRQAVFDGNQSALTHQIRWPPYLLLGKV